MSANDIPGYVQGFIFDDRNSAYYNSGTKVFLDQSPYSGWGINDLNITAGTPTFSTLGSGRGVVMDNTVQGKFLCPTPWEGSVIVIQKADMTTNTTINPVVFGAAASVSSNGRLTVVRANASSFSHRLLTASATSTGNISATNQNPKILGYSFSQNTRRAYATEDGTTVASGAAVADSGSGVFCFSGNTADFNEGFLARWGNLSGTIGDFTLSVNPMTMFEMHWFKGNVLLDYPTEMAAFWADRKAYYGI